MRRARHQVDETLHRHPRAGDQGERQRGLGERGLEGGDERGGEVEVAVRFGGCEGVRGLGREEGRVGGEGGGPGEEEVGEGDEAEDGGVVVGEGEVEGQGLGEGVVKEDEGGDGGAAAELFWQGNG